jgi:hypothetical protein
VDEGRDEQRTGHGNRRHDFRSDTARQHVRVGDGVAGLCIGGATPQCNSLETTRAGASVTITLVTTLASVVVNQPPPRWSVSRSAWSTPRQLFAWRKSTLTARLTKHRPVPG